MRKPVKAELAGLFLGADFIINYVIDSGWFKSFLSGAYNMIQAGKSLVEVIGYGIAWVFMKALRGIFWLIEKIMDVTKFITGTLGLSNTWFDQIMDKYIDPAISWVNDKILYLKEKVMGAIDRLADAVGTMVNTLFSPVLMGIRVIMSEFGNLLYNFSKLTLSGLIKVRKAVSSNLGAISDAARGGLEHMISMVANIGATGIRMMPGAERSVFHCQILRTNSRTVIGEGRDRETVR